MIERNNQALLDRLEKLAQKPVIQDDQTDKDLDHKRNFHAHMVQLRRQREARRITEANLLMLERITDATPVYNHAKWEVQNPWIYIKLNIKFPCISNIHIV